MNLVSKWLLHGKHDDSELITVHSSVSDWSIVHFIHVDRCECADTYSSAISESSSGELRHTTHESDPCATSERNSYAKSRTFR